MSSEVRRIRGVVRGRVQGVNFRSFTAAAGRRLGLSGWVCNRDDGTVEFEAQGDSDAVARMLEAVAGGPPFARVDGVDSHELPTTKGDEESFVVRR